jgi:hypothetical protein
MTSTGRQRYRPAGQRSPVAAGVQFTIVACTLTSSSPSPRPFFYPRDPDHFRQPVPERTTASEIRRRSAVFAQVCLCRCQGDQPLRSRCVVID